MHSFFFRALQLMTDLLLIRDSFIHFPFSIPFGIYEGLYFCSTKSMNCLTLKRHNSYKKKNKRKATHSFTPRPLIFKLQQEV